MSSGTVSVRYARALLGYATENNAGEQVYGEMKNLLTSFQRVPELSRVISDPTVPVERKIQLLATAVTDGKCSVSLSTQRFLELVFRENREEFLVLMVSSYISMYRESQGIIFTKLITAVPVGSDTIVSFESIIHAAGGKGRVEWDVRIDPSIEGGFILQVDDRRLDASIAAQIRKIKKELIDNNKRMI